MSGFINKWYSIKNLVGLVVQGKSQSQDFIDKLHGLSHMFVQVVSLVCWYPLSFTDRVSSRSSLLLQIVDSRPSWILVSVFRGATLNLKDWRYPTGLFEWVVWLKYPVLCILVIIGVSVHLSWVNGKSPLSGLLPCLFLFWFVPCFYSIFVSLLYCWPYLSLFPMPKKVHMWVLVCGVLFHLLAMFLFHCGGLVSKT